MNKEKIIRAIVKNGFASVSLSILFWCPAATNIQHSALKSEHEEIGHISYSRGAKNGDYIDINSTKIHCNVGLSSRSCPYTSSHFKIGQSKEIYKAQFIKYKSHLRDHLILIELSRDGIPLYGYSRSDLEYYRNEQRSNSNSFTVLSSAFVFSLLTFLDWRKQKTLAA